MRNYDLTSQVEALVLERSGRKLKYEPTERAGIIEVGDFPTLGRLVALRFLEWMQKNPEGVVSLPTGKTPEHFIKWTTRLLNEWDAPESQTLLGAWGLDTKKKPDVQSFRFVQIDEFFPMNPAQANSFAHYIKRFYLGDFGLDPDRALLMDTWKVGAPNGRDLDWVFRGEQADLSLRYRAPKGDLQEMQAAAIEAADQAAMEYEDKIRDMGGIGFFLGGIGPDGHIGFNIRGSDHYSTTRLSAINYETAAAAAGDLGGIEISRDKVVLTIGLQTITSNPNVVAIVMAAGEGKAKVIRDAVESPPSVRYPGTALHACPGARYYLTRGAAKLLIERRYADLKALDEPSYTDRSMIMLDLAYAKKKRLTELAPADLKDDRLGEFLPQKAEALSALAEQLTTDLRERIAAGTKSIEGATFLHTGPHHDDIMLGYLPYIIHLVRSPKNKHYFATLTSGFTSVTNAYVLAQFEKLEKALELGLLRKSLDDGYYAPDNMNGRTQDVYRYLDGVAARSEDMQDEAEARRMLRNLIALTGKSQLDALKTELQRLIEYLRTRYPGQKDTPEVQRLKGMVREWEEELTWAHLGFNCETVPHLRLGFYTGDIFTPQPTFERDAEPIIQLFEDTNPDIVTVTIDPEGAGPDTHYKVLQATSAALKAYLERHPGKKLEVWGYRNVWYRFHAAEANRYVPVSMNSLSTMRAAFETCYGSQRAASFPSYEYDGPFCDLAQRIMVEQYSVVKNALGGEYFFANPVPRMRASRGINYLVTMTPDEFIQRARELRKQTEA